MGEERIKDILTNIQKIKESNKSIRSYFENNYVPFTRVQYYHLNQLMKKYQKRIIHQGYY